MKQAKNWLFLLAAAAGAAAFYCGGFVLTAEPFKAAAALCLGSGAAVFCLGLGSFLGARMIAKEEEKALAQKKNKAKGDDRDARIREKVGAAANRVTMAALVAAVPAMALMRVELTAVVLVAAVLLLQLVVSVTLAKYYAKKM